MNITKSGCNHVSFGFAVWFERNLSQCNSSKHSAQLQYNSSDKKCIIDVNHIRGSPGTNVFVIITFTPEPIGRNCHSIMCKIYWAMCYVYSGFLRFMENPGNCHFIFQARKINGIWEKCQNSWCDVIHSSTVLCPLYAWTLSWKKSILSWKIHGKLTEKNSHSGVETLVY